MVLQRLPRLRDTTVAPEDAFAGTFHVNESYCATAGRVRRGGGGPDSRRWSRPRPTATRSPTHRSCRRSWRQPGAQTLTVFALHMPARLFRHRRARRRRRSTATLRVAELGAGRADRGLPDARRGGTPLPRGAHAARARGRAGSARRQHLPPRRSAGRLPRHPRRSGAGASRPSGRTCGSAAPAPVAVAASAASRGTTRRWRSWQPVGGGDEDAAMDRPGCWFR